MLLVNNELVFHVATGEGATLMNSEERCMCDPLGSSIQAAALDAAGIHEALVRCGVSAKASSVCKIGGVLQRAPRRPQCGRSSRGPGRRRN